MSLAAVTVRLAALAAAVALAGCASIPTSGPVRPGQEAAVQVDDSVIRVLAPPPRAGASPAEIVRGFLLASASFEGDYAAARPYLAPGVRARWVPDAGVRIYDSDSFELEATDQEVLASFRQIATIDADGRFARTPQPLETTVRFGMTKVGGEWRVGDLPDWLLLTTFDVGRTFRALHVYYLDPDRSILVPDLVLLPSRPAMATVLTNRLLRGPSSWLAPAVESAFPPGTALNVASVPVVDGVAEVDLEEAALTANPSQRQWMSAQLVWTLRQLTEVRSVRITVDDRDFPVPGAGDEQARDSWPNFDPRGLPASAVPYILRDGRLGTFEGGDFVPLPGPAGEGTTSLTRPAVSLSGDLVAGVSEDGGTLLRGRIGEEEELAPVLTGVDLAAPSWDRAGNLWTVDRAAGASDGAVQLAQPDGTVSAVAVDPPDPGSMELGSIRGIRLARDGTRVALVVQRPGEAAREELLIGAVARAENGRVPVRITNLVSIAPQLVEIRDVAWRDADHVAVVAREGEGAVRPLVVAADGYTSTSTSPIDAVDVAAAPAAGQPLLVGTADGHIYASAGLSWDALGPGSAPIYPG